MRGHVDLARLSSAPHLYGLGPLEGVVGEVSIFGGVPSIARVERGAVVTRCAQTDGIAESCSSRRGTAASDATADVFAAGWDFWALVAEPVAEFRRRYGIPPLAAAADATLALLAP